MFGFGTPEILFLMALFIILPTIKGFMAASKNIEFKVLVFTVAFVETFGFVICITIILIPLGMLLVLVAQNIKVNIQTEKNTRIQNFY